jgi:hypothetical protein
MASLAPRARRRAAPPSPAAGLPDLYAQLTPRQKRLAPTSARYWLSGYPALVAQWHPTKNPDLFPDVLRYGSPRKVWWKCTLGTGPRVVCPGHRPGEGRGMPVLHESLCLGDQLPGSVAAGRRAT